MEEREREGSAFQSSSGLTPLVTAAALALSGSRQAINRDSTSRGTVWPVSLPPFLHPLAILRSQRRRVPVPNSEGSFYCYLTLETFSIYGCVCSRSIAKFCDHVIGGPTSLSGAGGNIALPFIGFVIAAAHSVRDPHNLDWPERFCKTWHFSSILRR